MTQTPSQPAKTSLSQSAKSAAPLLSSRTRFEFLLRSILRRCGIDRAVAYTLAGRGWTVVSGPLTLYLVARCLDPNQQGFYYTFNSIIGLNIFFELGLTYVLLQFASHEKASLEWTIQGTVSGSCDAQARLAALLKLASKWYAVAAILVTLIVLPVGILFFERNSLAASTIVWKGAWVWLTIGSALDLLSSPLIAILEGCGKVSQVASMRLAQNVLSSFGLWLTLLLHHGLFSLPVDQTVNVVVAVSWLYVGYRRFFGALIARDTSQAPFSWRSEVWPFQWRIALSWLSGYFIFQLFNPVLFATHGSVVAGQMGMSVAVCNALLGVSIAWMSTKASPFGILVARRKWQELDHLFFRTYAQSATVVVGGGAVGLTAVIFLNRYQHPFATRLLSPGPFSFLLLATIINHAVFCEAQYLRTHKSEPFLWLSISAAILTGTSTLVLAKPFGAMGVSAGYLTCCVITIIWATRIFVHKRRVWHI